VACVKQLLAELFADSHYRFGFITYDSTVHFYNLASTAKRPQLMTVGEVHNMFLPMPTANMLVRYGEHKAQIDELLDKLPVMFQHTGVNESALGAALNAAALMLNNTGGKVFVLQAGRPMFGPGAIKPREDLKLLNTDKEKTLLTSDNAYFKKLGEECLKRAVSIDMIVAPNAYVDLASISEVSHVTQGRVYYMPHFDVHRDHATLWHTLRRSLSHRIVFEAALRVRASSGISVASYDLGGLPHAGPDVSLAAMDSTTTLAVTLTHDESLEDRPDKPVLVQCAVAHTTPYGQRMIRVHTLALRTTASLLNAYRAIDLDALLGHLSRAAVIDTTNLSLTDARARLVERSAKLLAGYRKYCAKSSAEGQLVLPDTLKHFPLYISGMLKHPLLSNLSPIWAHVVSITDQRVALMRMFADQPLDKLGTLIHPHLFALHKLDEEDGRIHAGFTKLPDISRLAMEMVRPDGIYLLHDTLQIFIYIGPNASHELLQQLFPSVDPSQVPSLELAHLPFTKQENDFSQRVWNIIEWLQASSLYFPKITLVRPRDPNIAKFAALLIEDERSVPGKMSKKGNQDILSYADFLVHIHKRIQEAIN
jgi:protein transport protein SEC24